MCIRDRIGAGGVYAWSSMEINRVSSALTAAQEDLAEAQDEIEALTSPKRVGLILATGGLGDKSFNDISYAGVLRAHEELGIEFDYVEPRAIAEYEGFQRDFAMTGDYVLIICIGSIRQTPSLRLQVNILTKISPSSTWS